jgi:hypothetical protein
MRADAQSTHASSGLRPGTAPEVPPAGRDLLHALSVSSDGPASVLRYPPSSILDPRSSSVCIRVHLWLSLFRVLFFRVFRAFRG